MRKLLHIFKPKREELFPAGVVLLCYALLSVLFVLHFGQDFKEVNVGVWKDFDDAWSVSGFDATGYRLLTEWDCVYSAHRHPLLTFLLWPFYVVNQGLILLTGANQAPWIMAVALLFCAFYSCVFLYRIFREVMLLERRDSILLTLFIYGFAYMLLTFLAPDHFAYSFFLLVLAAYISGKRMRSGRPLKIVQTAIYFLLTAGVTLSNGIKILIDTLFVNGRRFFRPRYLFLGVLAPCAFIWVVATTVYHGMEKPRQEALQEARERKESGIVKKMRQRFMDSTSIGDSSAREAEFQRILERREAKKARIAANRGVVKHRGKPISNEGFGQWTDISTSRWDAAVENFFGETFQFHRQFFLGDVLRQRPVVVRYDLVVNYVFEAVLFVLFLTGIWMGRRSRYLWMLVCGFCFDLLIHFGLGFGLNEVYIMAAHWVFIVPIALSYILRGMRKGQIWLRGVLVMLTLFLWGYNYGMLVFHFL